MMRPLRQHRDAVGEREDDVHVVLDDDLGHAARLDLLEEIDRAVGVEPRHAGGRLVEEQQARLLDQAHGQLQPPLVAARQARRLLLHVVLQADVLDHLARLVVQLALVVEVLPGADAEGAVALGHRRDEHVVQHGQVGEDLRRLEDAGDAELVDLVRMLAGERGAVEADRAGVGRHAGRRRC